MLKKLSIKNKIAFSVIGIIAVFGIAAAIIVFFIAKQNFIAVKKDDVKSESVEQAHIIGQTLEKFRHLAEAGALQQELGVYIERGAQPQDSSVLELLRTHTVGGAYDSVSLLDSSGITLVSTDFLSVGSSQNFHRYVGKALDGQPFIEVAVEALTGRFEYHFAYPVRSVDGRVVGIFVGKIFGDTIDALLHASVLDSSGNVMLVDESGIVFYSNVSDRLHKGIGSLSAEDKKDIAERRLSDGTTIPELQYEQVAVAIRTYVEPVVFDFYDASDGDREIISVTRIYGTPFFLVVEAGTKRFTDAAFTISITLSIVAFFAALIATAFIYFISARILRPVGLLREAAERVKAGDYTYQLAIATGDEIEDVSHAFNEMTRNLRASYADLNQKVDEKTVELSKQLQEIENKNNALQDTQRAVLNVLEDSREIELQMQEERDYLQGIISSMSEGLFVLDKSLRIILANPTAAQILGVPMEKLVNAYLPDVIRFYKGKETLPEEERPLHRVIRERITLNADVKDDFYWEVRGGRRFSLGLAAAPISVRGLVGGVIVFRDLTKEKNLDEARTSFISITSHQLRTPLTSLKWFLEMLMDGSYATPLTSEQHNFADLAYQSADRMMGIINLLLQIARVEAGRVKIVPTATDLRQFAVGVVASFGNTFDLKHQTVEIKSVPESLPPVLIDADIFGQVLQNLISNANRYALEHTAIKIAFVAEGDRIVCSVADKGIGISKNDATRIFEKFYRAENALRMVPEGSGLGLSLVKSLVEGWGGTIWFESEESIGTTFFFTLPLSGMIAREGEVGIRVA